jgi:membrane protease YdiL (CAAX protease family)
LIAVGQATIDAAKSSRQRSLPTLVGLSLPLANVICTAVLYGVPGLNQHDAVVRGVRRASNGVYYVNSSARSLTQFVMEVRLLSDLALIVALLVLILIWERRPLRSIGLQWPSKRDWLATAAAVLLWFPLTLAVDRMLPDSLRESAAMRVAILSIPMELRLTLLLVSPFFEELLFRAYLIERVEELTDRTWLAAALSVVSDTLLHLGWGAGALVQIAPMIMLQAGFYIWRRSLPASAVLHVVADSPIVLWTILFSYARR